MRLAYSWRSEFLTNNLDCCIGLPMWQKAGGYLDGSVRLQVGNNVELSLDGSEPARPNHREPAATVRRFVADARRRAGTTRLGVDSKRSPIPARLQVQVLT